MSKNKRRKKKSSGCVGFCAVLILVGLVVAVLVYTGVLGSVRLSVERAIYPLEYRDDILKAAEDYNLEPELIAAVIYTESKFDEDAVSSAGAVGLMQLMPDTFEWLVSKRGESLSQEDLYNPRVNIDYGAYYLSYLYERFEDTNTVCAAYNAGPTKVEQWLESADYSTDGDTLYSIPYKETLNYVNKVENTTEKYKELYFG